MNMVDVNSGAAPQPGGYAGEGSETRGNAVPMAESAGIPVEVPEELSEEEANEIPTPDVEEELKQEEAPLNSEGDSEGGSEEPSQGGDADEAPETPEEGDGNEGEDEDYSGEEWTYAALKEEIDRRNEDREDADHLSKGGSTDDLRLRLMEDDEAQAESDSEDE